jgi:hypothetical protein
MHNQSTLLVGLLVCAFLVVMGSLKVHILLPWAATNSGVISAACHRPKEDREGYLIGVQWGEVPDSYTQSTTQVNTSISVQVKGDKTGHSLPSTITVSDADQAASRGNAVSQHSDGRHRPVGIIVEIPKTLASPSNTRFPTDNNGRDTPDDTLASCTETQQRPMPGMIAEPIGHLCFTSYRGVQISTQSGDSQGDQDKKKWSIRNWGIKNWKIGRWKIGTWSIDYRNVKIRGENNWRVPWPEEGKLYQ